MSGYDSIGFKNGTDVFWYDLVPKKECKPQQQQQQQEPRDMDVKKAFSHLKDLSTNYKQKYYSD